MHLSKPIQPYSTNDENKLTLETEDLRKEHRLWQKYLVILQTCETISTKTVGKKGPDLSNFEKGVKFIKLKTKRNYENHSI
jgi:hypothetical protein